MEKINNLKIETIPEEVEVYHFTTGDALDKINENLKISPSGKSLSNNIIEQTSSYSPIKNFSGRNGCIFAILNQKDSIGYSKEERNKPIKLKVSTNNCLVGDISKYEKCSRLINEVESYEEFLKNNKNEELLLEFYNFLQYCDKDQEGIYYEEIFDSKFINLFSYLLPTFKDFRNQMLEHFVKDIVKLHLIIELK